MNRSIEWNSGKLLVDLSLCSIFIVSSRFVNCSATEAKVKAKMRENQDVQTYYYQPVSTRYYKYASEINRRAPEEGGTS